MSNGFDLQNKVELVTGGSRGIGASTVRLLVESNARVILHYGRGHEEADAMAREIGLHRCYTVAADLAAPDAGFRLWESAIEWIGHIDVLVNNAAMVTPLTIE